MGLDHQESASTHVQFPKTCNQQGVWQFLFTVFKILECQRNVFNFSFLRNHQSLQIIWMPKWHPKLQHKQVQLLLANQCVPGRDNMEDRLIKKQWRKGVLVLQASFRDQCFAKFRLPGNVLNRRPLSSSGYFWVSWYPCATLWTPIRNQVE